MSFRTVSLFSGAGGLDLGFSQAGFNIVWANDTFSEAVETYRRNIGDHIWLGDIALVNSEEIPGCDVVIGGFPCQGFSVANTGRSTGDTRNRLYLEFVRIIRDKKPIAFIAENVKGILSLGSGKVFERIISDFSEAGYVVNHAVLNAADYGVPQRRERVFLFGLRQDCFAKTNGKMPFPPAPTHAERQKALLLGLKPWIGIGDALELIPEPDRPHNLANHEASKYKLRFNGYLGHRSIEPTLPCPTLTARGDDRGGVVIHHHPSNTRRLTAREAAIVQSFPLDFVFCGKKTSAYRQIANAVPPSLARHVAAAVKSTLLDLDLGVSDRSAA